MYFYKKYERELSAQTQILPSFKVLADSATGWSGTKSYWARFASGVKPVWKEFSVEFYKILRDFFQSIPIAEGEEFPVSFLFEQTDSKIVWNSSSLLTEFSLGPLRMVPFGVFPTQSTITNATCQVEPILSFAYSEYLQSGSGNSAYAYAGEGMGCRGNAFWSNSPQISEFVGVRKTQFTTDLNIEITLHIFYGKDYIYLGYSNGRYSDIQPLIFMVKGKEITSDDPVWLVTWHPGASCTGLFGGYDVSSDNAGDGVGTSGADSANKAGIYKNRYIFMWDSNPMPLKSQHKNKQGFFPSSCIIAPFYTPWAPTANIEKPFVVTVDRTNYSTTKFPFRDFNLNENQAILQKIVAYNSFMTFSPNDEVFISYRDKFKPDCHYLINGDNYYVPGSRFLLTTFTDNGPTVNFASWYPFVIKY